MRQLTFKCDYKAASDGTFTGHAAVIGNLDLGGDRIMPGAFDRDLAERGTRRPLLYNHQPVESAPPIGWVELAIDGRGLKVTKGQLILEIPRAAETFALLRHGVADSMSIGYTTIDERRARDGARELLEVKVFEVSVVIWPMNPQARVTSVKHEQDQLAAALDALREARAAITSDVGRRQADELRDLIDGLRHLKGQIR